MTCLNCYTDFWFMLSHYVALTSYKFPFFFVSRQTGLSASRFASNSQATTFKSGNRWFILKNICFINLFLNLLYNKPITQILGIHNGVLKSSWSILHPKIWILWGELLDQVNTSYIYIQYHVYIHIFNIPSHVYVKNTMVIILVLNRRIIKDTYIDKYIHFF